VFPCSLVPLIPGLLGYTGLAMNAVSVRGDWVGQVIDGKYPLLEWLGGSGTSGTFLTELDGSGSQKAALKLIPPSSRSGDHLAGWAAAAKLASPHLAAIHHYGHAQVHGNDCVYIVTDLAEELLSQIIPERPLTVDEARQMLDPILNALESLHKAGFVHGHLKPSNVLVVENDIRLSPDGLLPIGKPAPALLTNDIHTAPEIAREPVSPHADIWSLGVTLVEALTQQLPIWDAAGDTEPILPASIPAPFAEIARRCLHTDPARRCTLAEIRALLDGPVNHVAAKPPRAPSSAPDQNRLADKPLPARMPFLPLVIGLLLLALIIVGLQFRGRKTNSAPLQTDATRPPATEANSKPAEQASGTTTPHAPERVSPAPPAREPAAPVVASTATASGDVLNRDVPDVSQRARNTIHGTVGVVVRVNVDTTGAVSNAEYATHGPSAYFARIALESARKWKFRPPQQDSRALPSSWLLHFKFRRGGVDVTPNQAKP
jgi:TonB family protein